MNVSVEAPQESLSNRLLVASPDQWLSAVLDDFNEFLRDHAANEKKASGMALSLAAHYPDRRRLVHAMTELAVEEISHYREVVRILHERNEDIGRDKKDPYINALRDLVRTGRDEYFLDRLLVAGVIEARGTERFALLAQALQNESSSRFYQSLVRSEARHADLFTDLAETYFPSELIEQRLQELLNAEAQILIQLPVRAALH